MKLDYLMKAYLDVCKYKSNLDPKTVKAYRIDLQQFYDFVENKDLYCTKEVLIEYIYCLNKKGYKIKTVKRKIASLKAFFAYLNFEDIILVNPFVKIKTKMKEPLVLPKTIPLEQLNDLFVFVYNKKKKTNKNSHSYKCIVRNIAVLELLFGTGIRISELCTLKNDDIDLKNYNIKILGKGSKERIIPVYEEHILKSLQLYKELFFKDILKSSYFFINKRKNQLSGQSVRNMIVQCCKEAKIPLHITPHMFRHTFATTLLESDVDSRYIQQLLGHSSIVTTQIYTHLRSNKKIEIMKQKNPRSKIIVNEG